jgi:uncharacterized lipoprotein YmbA
LKPYWFVFALLLAGCAGAPAPETEYFLLRSRADTTGVSDGLARISLGKVRVASYIDRAGIVVETDSGSLRPARYNQWAEPLREGLRIFLADEIAANLGRPVRAAAYGDTEWRSQTDAVIDLHIDTLHGTRDGAAILVARWAVIDPSERRLIAEHEFSGRETLSASGYASLVEAQRRLLEQFARALARSL